MENYAFNLPIGCDSGYRFLPRRRERWISLAERKLGLGNPLRAGIRALALRPGLPPPARREGRGNHGFTLIELAVVLVIIGLIVGAVLAGQDLIRTSQVRAQISQVEKYNTAANTFREKYSGLPGDLPVNLATQFGFNTTNCTGSMGSRDGNGLIDGSATGGQYSQTQGETGLFWQDLSASHLISDTVPNSGSPITCPFNPHVLNSTPGSTYVGNYFPSAKIGTANFMYVYENNGSNWYGISAILATDTSGSLISQSPALTVQQAYLIDSKVDDGNPVTGNVIAFLVYNANYAYWAPNAPTDSATTCYHSNSGASYGYSITYNNGSGVNCYLSFRMQAGD